MHNTENDTPECKTISPKAIMHAFNMITRLMESKSRDLAIRKTAADIAAEAVVYALGNRGDGKRHVPTSEEHIIRSAVKTAKWRLRDEIRRLKHEKVLCTLDEREEMEDGESLEQSAAEVSYSMDLYHERLERRENMEKGRKALSKLDKFLSARGVSQRDIAVYKARDIYVESTEDVCRRHSIKPSNVHRIVSIVNAIIVKEGRLLLA